jgi:hypothetical protein
MGIRDRPISPRSPWQNPYVECLIGTLRRECLDHVLIFGERHLRRVLTLYFGYYNEHARISDWVRTRRYDEPSKDLVRSSLRQSCPDCIIATHGYSFREGHPPRTTISRLAMCSSALKYKAPARLSGSWHIGTLPVFH